LHVHRHELTRRARKLSSNFICINMKKGRVD
jgi:hypothetical protein